MAEALWRVAHGRSSIEAFLAQFGFRGPVESETSSRSWREDPGPIEGLLDQMASAPADHEPTVAEHRRRLERRRAQRILMQSLSLRDRFGAVVALILGRRHVPLRQVGKASLVHVFDVARACARSVGRELTDQGRLDDPEDVFFLTIPEAVEAGQHSRPFQELVTWRRERRLGYLRMEIPRDFYGVPEPAAPAAPADSPPGDGEVTTLSGQGVSGGRVEGRARILAEAAQPIQSGEILVAEFTDPGWTPAIAVAGAVVLDVGGIMSHGAIIARELGIPCVLGTGRATSVIRDGDLLGVDGARGLVEILERADAAGTAPGATVRLAGETNPAQPGARG